MGRFCWIITAEITALRTETAPVQHLLKFIHQENCFLLTSTIKASPTDGQTVSRFRLEERGRRFVLLLRRTASDLNVDLRRDVP